MIGVFDSGAGGLSVWRELYALMPRQSYLYVSDAAHCPYGPRSAEYIQQRARAITDYMLSQGADLIVVACNTATAAAISCLRASYDIPFVGMEPALKPAALHSASGVIGVLATAGTFKGMPYQNTLAHFASEVKVIERVGEGLVEAVERGDIATDDTIALLHRYIDPMLEQGADHIVLGCTHYPFLTQEIEKIVAGRATIVNPAPAVARQAARLLPSGASEGGCTFISTGSFSEPVKEFIHSICKENPHTILDGVRI